MKKWTEETDYATVTAFVLRASQDYGKDFFLRWDNFFTSVVWRFFPSQFESCSPLAQESSYVGSLSDLALLPYVASSTQQIFRWNDKKNKHQRAKGAAFENRVSGVQHFSFAVSAAATSASGPWTRSYSLPIYHVPLASTSGKIYIPSTTLFLMRCSRPRLVPKKIRLLLSIAHQIFCSFPAHTALRFVPLFHCEATSSTIAFQSSLAQKRMMATKFDRRRRWRHKRSSTALSCFM